MHLRRFHPPAKDRRPCRIHSLFLIGLQVHLTEVGRAYIFDFKKTLLNVEILLKPDSSDTSVIVRSGFFNRFSAIWSRSLVTKSVKERPVYARNSLEKWQRENPATFDASSRETGSVQ